jgi:uncharacterized membrane protein YebE (DUF533 family)
MGFSDLLGALMQTGMTPSSNQRLQNALGGSTGQTQASGAQTSASGGGGGIAGMFGDVLNRAGQAVGGKQNLAIGGLGALAGALLGGRRSLGGAIGGGAMALLGVMAFKALQGNRQNAANAPAEIPAPQNQTDQLKMEQDAEIVLKAMVNAAKSDGQVDAKEIQRIIDKLKEAGATPQEQQYVLDMMNTPMETEFLINAAKGRQELAVQIYAASLMAIEVDTLEEKAYLESLASGLGLSSDVIRNIEQMVGLKPV